MKESVAYIVNQKIQADPIIQAIFDPSPVIVYPGYANEPLGGDKSYPYIRYFSTPHTSWRSTLLRRDSIHYIVGAKDLTVIARAIERLIYILNSPDNMADEWPVTDLDGRYKVMDILFTGSSPQDLPSQDEGVWEQGLYFVVIYTNLSPGWGTTRTNQMHVDSLLI